MLTKYFYIIIWTWVQGFSFLVMILEDSKTVFGCRQKQQYLYILFYYDNMFRSTDYHRAIYKSLLITF